MSQQGNDHYVPQFILRRFLPKGKGRRKERLFYAEKATPGISRRGAARTFCEVGGDLLLRGPPAIRQEGTHAILADEPEYTTGLREHLSRREHRWAPAIKHLVEAVYRQRRSHARQADIIRLERAPPNHAQWCANAMDYCVRQMHRSPEAGNELWSRMLETEEKELRAWIRTKLGQALEPSDELRAMWRDHNRHKMRTGAEADAKGLWDDVDSTMILTTWCIMDDSQFILGSRGGVWVDTDAGKLWICPVDPRVALGIEGRRRNAESLGVPSDKEHHFAKGYFLPRDNLAVGDINRASWNQCRAVAGLRRQDVADVIGIPVSQAP